MSYRITWKTRENQRGLDPRIAVLEDGKGGCVEVWPALGFNAYRWAVKVGEQTHELLYADPKLFEDGRPTRSGIPILFPFPNRIRDGKYTWNGKTFQLPLTGDGGKTAIHGFACRVPWRVIDEGANAESAWITGEFQISKDDPASLEHWPADGRLRVTYVLEARTALGLTGHMLRITAEVCAAAKEALPFGLGYHPYFAVAPYGGEQARVMVQAQRFWNLDANLPTGKREQVYGYRDLRGGASVEARASLEGRALDDVLTDLTPMIDESPTQPIAYMSSVDNGRRLAISGSSDFREVVVFTPPHREAFCIEPYTCTTDAINLQAAGHDAGWKALKAGETWLGHVIHVFGRV